LEFLLGLLGAVCGIGCFAVGALWGRRAKPAAAALPAPSEEEARRVREQQQAFLRLQNYTVDDAYGRGRG